jgi:hypothetical protein
LKSTFQHFFTAENASNNEKALELLATVIDIKPVQARLLCTAHIINLLSKANLYGVDFDCFEALDDEDTDDLDTSSISKFKTLHAREMSRRSSKQSEKRSIWQALQYYLPRTPYANTP